MDEIHGTDKIKHDYMNYPSYHGSVRRTSSRIRRENGPQAHHAMTKTTMQAVSVSSATLQNSQTDNSLNRPSPSKPIISLDTMQVSRTNSCLLSSGESAMETLMA
jgi:hypothetical protein